MNAQDFLQAFRAAGGTIAIVPIGIEGAEQGLLVSVIRGYDIYCDFLDAAKRCGRDGVAEIAVALRTSA